MSKAACAFLGNEMEYACGTGRNWENFRAFRLDLPLLREFSIFLWPTGVHPQNSGEKSDFREFWRNNPA
ncbi:MAG: hypothetical protein ACJAVM_000659 [Sulfitobacter sp.]|jgi:hypothetical protein